MPQATTPLSVCFTMDDFKLDPTGLTDAIRAFWENNPAVQAVKDAVKAVIKPIEFAVEQVETFVKSLKDFDGLSFGRRLEELAPAYTVHAYGLKDQAHRQLEKVRGRLLHADNDNAHESIKERLQLDVYRRLEAFDLLGAAATVCAQVVPHISQPGAASTQSGTKNPAAWPPQWLPVVAGTSPSPSTPRTPSSPSVLAWTQLREVARQSTAVTTVPPG